MKKGDESCPVSPPVAKQGDGQNSASLVFGNRNWTTAKRMVLQPGCGSLNPSAGDALGDGEQHQSESGRTDQPGTVSAGNPYGPAVSAGPAGPLQRRGSADTVKSEVHGRFPDCQSPEFSVQ
jgi:hypothetical protein